MEKKDFQQKLKSMQTKCDVHYEDLSEYSINRYIFSLNGIYWHYYINDEWDGILSVQILKKNISQKILFTNIDIIKEHPVNKDRNIDEQLYIINPNDFIYKLNF